MSHNPLPDAGNRGARCVPRAQIPVGSTKYQQVLKRASPEQIFALAVGRCTTRPQC